MRIELTADVFDSPDALLDLLNLLRSVTEGRHDWEASPDIATVARRYLDGQVPSLAPTYATLGEKGTVSGVWRGRAESGTVVRVSSADLADLTADLLRPAVLVVENDKSDGSFVRCIAEVFWAGKLDRALREGWMELRNGGGQTLVGVAEREAGHGRRLVRVAAVLDSDRLVPGQPTAAHDKAGRLAKSGIAVHVLELREAENYVPNRVLAAQGTQARRKLSQLRKLSPVQRGYVDMKKGFGPADRPPQVPVEQQDLFGNLDQQVLNGLRDGFGRNLLPRMEAMSHSLREEDFVGPGADVPGELRRMLDTLASVI